MGMARPQRKMGYGFGAADLVRVIRWESKVLDPVEQAVEFAVVPG